MKKETRKQERATFIDPFYLGIAAFNILFAANRLCASDFIAAFVFIGAALLCIILNQEEGKHEKD